jgi:hypothetical protein
MSDFRFYQSPFSNAVSFPYVWDADLILTRSDDSIMGTGGYRPLEKTDLAATISGDVNIDLSSTNTLISSTNDLLALTNGYIQATNALIISETGLITTSNSLLTSANTLLSAQTGTFSPTFNIITSSQVQIPANAKSWSVAVESGSAFINGSGPINAGTALNGGGYNGAFKLSAAINVGCTGGRAIIVYEV